MESGSSGDGSAATTLCCNTVAMPSPVRRFPAGFDGLAVVLRLALGLSEFVQHRLVAVGVGLADCGVDLRRRAGRPTLDAGPLDDHVHGLVLGQFVNSFG